MAVAGSDDLISPEGGAPPGIVASLDERRRRRAGRLVGVRAAAIAAVVVLAAGVGLAVADMGGGSGPGHVIRSALRPAIPQDSSTTALPRFAPTPEFAAPDEVFQELGPVASDSGLVATLRAHLPAAIQAPSHPPSDASSGASASSGKSAGCPSRAALPAGLDSAEPVYRADLTYKGTPATVFVYKAGGHHIAVVTRNADCEVLARIPF
jgi:hypothetical protein